MLWLLLLPNSGHVGDGAVERVNGVVRFSQFGSAHLHGTGGTGAGSSLVVTLPYVSQKQFKIDGRNRGFTEARGTVNQFVGHRVQEPDSPGGSGEVILDLGKPQKGFAAQVAVIFRNAKPGTKVRYSFPACISDEEPHGITVMTVDRRGARQEMLFWQQVENLRASLSSRTSNDWFKSMAKVLADKPAEYVGASASMTDVHGYYGSVRKAAIVIEIEARSSGTIKVEVVGLVDEAGEPVADINETDKENVLNGLRSWCAASSTSGDCS